MARNLNTIPEITPPDADYPNGRVKNAVPPAAGTPVIEELYGDLVQFFHKLMRIAGLTHNGLPENETQGFQFIEALAYYVRSLQASTTQKGTSELADSAETQAGVDSQRVVTPAGLESKTATTTRKGIAETATDAEAIAKTLTTHILTPSNLSALVASTSLAGLIEIATTIEAKTGDTTRAITGDLLQNIAKTQLLEIISAGTYYIADNIGFVYAIVSGVTIRLPSSSIYHGAWQIPIFNASLGTLTVQTSSGSPITTIPANTTERFIFSINYNTWILVS